MRDLVCGAFWKHIEHYFIFCSDVPYDRPQRAQHSIIMNKLTSKCITDSCFRLIHNNTSLFKQIAMVTEFVEFNTGDYIRLEITLRVTNWKFSIRFT